MTVAEYQADPATALDVIRTSYDIAEVARALVALSGDGEVISDPKLALHALRVSYNPQDVTDALLTLSGTAQTIDDPYSPLHTLRTSYVASEVGDTLASLIALEGGTTPPGSVEGNYLLGSSITLPAGVTLQLDLPMDTVSTNPPPDVSGQGHNPSNYGSPTIQSTIKREGKTYAGYAPAGLNGTSSGHWTRATAGWNSLISNFALEAWVYLPTSAVYTAGYTNQLQTFIGGGGPNSGEPAFGVRRVAGVPKLCAGDGVGALEVVSSTTFPLDQWVHVAITHTHAPAATALYINGALAGSNTGGIFARGGGSYSFNVGSREYNSIWACGWGGYISNVRLYT